MACCCCCCDEIDWIFSNLKNKKVIKNERKIQFWKRERISKKVLLKLLNLVKYNISRKEEEKCLSNCKRDLNIMYQISHIVVQTHISA